MIALFLNADGGTVPRLVTVCGLYRALCDSSVSVLLMDVQSREVLIASVAPASAIYVCLVAECRRWRAGRRSDSVQAVSSPV